MENKHFYASLVIIVFVVAVAGIAMTYTGKATSYRGKGTLEITLAKKLRQECNGAVFSENRDGKRAFLGFVEQGQTARFSLNPGMTTIVIKPSSRTAQNSEICWNDYQEFSQNINILANQMIRLHSNLLSRD
ncbi:hypothetical protein J4436_02805 [Candidatus Woesearchaeota archaeon]|nr:hypothetical protein [Candidatus Woesearchaeota archaeon]